MMPWWLDWEIVAAFVALATAIWWALKPRRDVYDEEMPHECEYFDGPRPPKVTFATVEKDSAGMLLCVRCKQSAYASEICADPECPSTLMMRRLGIEVAPNYEELVAQVADLRQQLADMTKSRDEYIEMNSKNLRTATSAVANKSATIVGDERQLICTQCGFRPCNVYSVNCLKCGGKNIEEAKK